MEEISLLIGGKAGFGIDKASMVLGRLLNQIGYSIHIYRDYPSLIRGGHTFSIIRASKNKIASHSDIVDIVIALNQETLDLHKNRLKKDCLFIFDADQIKDKSKYPCGIGLALGEILKEEKAPDIMRNTCVVGALAKAIGIEFNILESVLKKEFTKDTDINLKIAQRGYSESKELIKIDVLKRESLPMVTGNQAIALGLVKGGLDYYFAYPMTPSSPVLHYLAEVAKDFSLDVIHPESEIAVILMALGAAYGGKKAAVGTSGGGFCLMTEGLSFSGMSELPVVIILGQRPGPSTGLPTYSAQTELHFALHAGQGEFARFIVAPGDAEEAYYWSAAAMNMSWKYRIPSIILSDKNLGEDVFNFDIGAIKEIKEETTPAPDKGAPIKVNSYEHDELGITMEGPAQTSLMQEKRVRKENDLAEELENFETVKVYANKDSKTAVLCWGSNKGVCVEASQKLGLRVIQPVVLNPFPIKQFREALKGVDKIICVENNATGQLAALIRGYGINIDSAILKYDGRPFSVNELEAFIKKAAI